jgi:hypothetical protein
MSNEVETIVRAFRANLMQEILFHRVIEGVGAIAAFKVNVQRHRERVLTKLQDMLSRMPDEPLEGAATTINNMADAVIARIEADSRVEFADGGL